MYSKRDYAERFRLVRYKRDRGDVESSDFFAGNLLANLRHETEEEVSNWECGESPNSPTSHHWRAYLGIVVLRGAVTLIQRNVKGAVHILQQG